MTKPVAVSFIGAGNLAWHLAPALDNAGYAVREVYSRDAKNAEALVERLYEAEVKTDLDFSSSKSSVFIIAVSDDMIGDISQEIALPGEAVLVVWWWVSWVRRFWTCSRLVCSWWWRSRRRRLIGFP